MADTRRLLSALQSLLADNTSGDISAQDLRDMLVSGDYPVEEHTAASSATLDFTSWYSSLYDLYELQIIGLIPATDGAILQLQFSSDGGSTWIATGYRYALRYLSSAAGAGNINSGSDTVIKLNGGQENTVGTSIGNTLVRIYNPGSSTRQKGVHIETVVQANDGNYYTQVGVGVLADTAAVNGVRLSYSSGNIAEGTARIYAR